MFGPGGILDTIGRPSCDTPLGGPDWPEGSDLFEAQPGFDAELASLDLGALPEAIDTSGLNTFELAYVAYALEETTCELLPNPDEDCVSTITPLLDRDSTRAKGKLGEVVLGALIRGPQATPSTALDFVFLRRGLHRYYACSRRFPTTLEVFKAEVFDYTDEPASVVESFPKLSERHIRTEGCLGIIVAEAIDDGEVQDTEILMTQSRTDGGLDFLAYDPSGRLADRGAFATAAGGLAIAAAPYVCTSCHINRDVRPNQFDVLFPSMTLER